MRALITIENLTIVHITHKKLIGFENMFISEKLTSFK